MYYTRYAMICCAPKEVNDYECIVKEDHIRQFEQQRHGNTRRQGKRRLHTDTQNNLVRECKTGKSIYRYTKGQQEKIYESS